MDTITTIPSLLKSNGCALPVMVALMPSDLRLIAAAPDLLEALEACAKVLAHHGIAPAVFRQTEAAIARTKTGEGE